MDRHCWLTVVAVLFVSTAGCAGITPDGGEPTPTASNPSEVTYPEGWTATAVNASVALRSHYTAVLTGPSATVTYRSSVVEVQGVPRRNTTGAYNTSVSPTYGSATDATGRVVVATDGRILEIDTAVTYTKGDAPVPLRADATRRDGRGDAGVAPERVRGDATAEGSVRTRRRRGTGCVFSCWKSASES
jgi:hypothetical protein